MRTERYYVDVVSSEGPIAEYAESYAIEDQRNTTNICWIPSETGKTFRVTFSNLSGDSIEARCFIDGRFLSRNLIRPGFSDYVDGVQLTDTTIRPFVFSDVALIDDETALVPTTYNPDKFGTIEVHVHRVIVREEYHWNMGQLHYSNPGPIPEKSKKAGCHQVSFGAVAMCQSVQCADVLMMDKPEKPRAKFVFKYRPRSLLQAEGVLPPTPPPTHPHQHPHSQHPQPHQRPLQHSHNPHPHHHPHHPHQHQHHQQPQSQQQHHSHHSHHHHQNARQPSKRSRSHTPPPGSNGSGSGSVGGEDEHEPDSHSVTKRLKVESTTSGIGVGVGMGVVGVEVEPGTGTGTTTTGVLYDTIDDIWQASMLLKPTFLGEQDLNLGLVDEELEALKTQRDALAEQLKNVDSKIHEVKSRKSSRSYEPPPPLSPHPPSSSSSTSSTFNGNSNSNHNSSSNGHSGMGGVSVNGGGMRRDHMSIQSLSNPADGHAFALS